MNQTENVEKSYQKRFFEEYKEEIRSKGYFQCSNPELWNDLYEELKPEIPTLYKSQSDGWQHLHVIRPEQANNIAHIIKTKQKLKDEIEGIDFILKNLGLNPEEY